MPQSRVTSTGIPLLEELLAQMAQGDPQALAEFYRLTSRAAYAFALSLLRNPFDAEDILQETYLRAWAHAGSYRPGGRPVGWLLAILRNLAYRKLQNQQRTEPLTPEELDRFFAARPAITPEDRLLLRAALLGLAEQERQIVLLHAAAGLRHREIAQLLGLPLGTVLAKYNRALKKLKAAWEEDQP